MKLRDVKKVIVSSAVTSATLLVIVAGASVFGEYLTFEQIPNKIANAVVANIQTPWVFLLAVNILLLIVGMFMDIISATLILTPIFLPLLPKFGIDTMHFGLLMTINLGIGYCTPPLGVSLYISGAVVDRDLLYVSKAVLPFLADPDRDPAGSDLLAGSGPVPAEAGLRLSRLTPSQPGRCPWNARFSSPSMAPKPARGPSPASSAAATAFPAR